MVKTFKNVVKVLPLADRPESPRQYEAAHRRNVVERGARHAAWGAALNARIERTATERKPKSVGSPDEIAGTAHRVYIPRLKR